MATTVDRQALGYMLSTMSQAWQAAQPACICDHLLYFPKLCIPSLLDFGENFLEISPKSSVFSPPPFLFPPYCHLKLPWEKRMWLLYMLTGWVDRRIWINPTLGLRSTRFICTRWLQLPSPCPGTALISHRFAASREFHGMNHLLCQRQLSLVKSCVPACADRRPSRCLPGSACTRTAQKNVPLWSLRDHLYFRSN